MKQLMIIVMILISMLTLQAQKDIIYPDIGKMAIRKCKITNVTEGNKVHFTKDSVSRVIEAVAIRKDGYYIDLYVNNIDLNQDESVVYKGTNYDYYEKCHRSAIKTRNVGIGLTLFGIGAGVIGGLSLGRLGNSKTMNSVYEILYVGGAVAMNIGVILWVSEGIRAANNSKAMKRAKTNANISLAFTGNGLGLVFKINNQN